jgi:hypothetical protein
MVMMVITTSSSINVNALAVRDRCVFMR